MARKITLFLVLVGGLLLQRPFSTHAQSPAPAQTAEQIRSALFAAQIHLGAPAAAQDLADAQAAYAGSFAAEIAAAAPAADGQIRVGLMSAATAVANGDASALAAARAQAWTGILAGGYAITAQAVIAGDAARAQQWLPVREFRPATRFSRPDADATLALVALAENKLTPEDALLAVNADLLNTYQAQLTNALNDLETAAANDFTIRQAELAAQASGYFALLAPAYSAQRGAAALSEAENVLASLQTAVLRGDELNQPLAQVTAVLHNFRAAPLSPDDRVRRAGQMLRFLALVPVEYERGVHDGNVTRELEIQEAVTFQAGAAAAFSDLQNLLDERDPAQTAAAATALQQLEMQLQDTATRAAIHNPADIQATTDQAMAILKELLPADWQTGRGAGDFDVIASLLDQMETAVAAGEYALAESARLEAYATLEIGPEARLIAFAPQAIPPLEDLFWNGQAEHAGLAYLIRQQATLPEVQASRAALDEALANAQAALTSDSAPAVVATNAGIIVFREGLEAVLILASLMASFKAAERRHLRRPMWLGAALAFVASIATWLLAQELLATLARYGERLEAVVSLIAIAVLLLITNWFFHKVYWTGWMANFHAQKRRLLGAQTSLWLGLMVLGFTSIYREGFESVLFLQALVLEGGTAVVLSGVALGLLGAFLIGVIVFALQAHLPYRKMLIFTGVLIGFVLLVMVGNTTHVWQVVGWLPLHPIRSLQFPFWVGTWFGTFPTWEGLTLQSAAAVFVLGSYFLAESVQARKRTGRATKTRMGRSGGFSRNSSG